MADSERCPFTADSLGVAGAGSSKTIDPSSKVASRFHQLLASNSLIDEALNNCYSLQRFYVRLVNTKMR